MKRQRPGITVDKFGERPQNNKLKATLMALDKEVTKFIYQIVQDSTSKSDTLYFKSEFKYLSYCISMYSTETHAIAGKQWPVTDFLQLGADKKLEMELNIIVKKLILTVQDNNNKFEEGKDEDKTIWI